MFHAYASWIGLDFEPFPTLPLYLSSYFTPLSVDYGGNDGDNGDEMEMALFTFHLFAYFCFHLDDCIMILF